MGGDSCTIAYGLGNSDGSQHSKSNLPVLLAGCGGSSLRPGRHICVTEETPLANLWLSLVQRMGVQVDRFGDSTGMLRGL